jgi:hypothetical protein
MLLLAACYDQSTASTFTGRWNQLRKTLRYWNLAAKGRMLLAIASAVASVVLVAWLLSWDAGSGGVGAAEEVQGTVVEPSPEVGTGGVGEENRTTLQVQVLWLIPLITLVGSLPLVIHTVKLQAAALGIRRHMRVGKRETSSLRKVLQQIPTKELASQPLPRYDRTDDRYELLNKFQSILQRLGFRGIVVLMDRVDEPDIIGGRPELMQRFVWPLLDNKLLKHPGIGFKIMLPQELYRDVERETREFHERARLDKQNVIPAFQWTGESLYDLSRARMLACAAENQTPEPKDLFSDEVSYERLLSAFQSLRVPRHLCRLLYRVLVDHCNRHTDAQPEFRIKGETFESALAVYSRDTELSLN